MRIEAGSRWSYGTMAPTPPQGQEGDYYFQANGTIWQKQGGLWQPVQYANIGQPGPAGPPGPPGQTGLTGIEGQTGPAGATGATGATGAQGAAGSQGVAGLGPAGPPGQRGSQIWPVAGTPALGLGNPGDWAFQNTGEVWYKQQAGPFLPAAWQKFSNLRGPQGPAGADAAPGPAGPAGPTGPAAPAFNYVPGVEQWLGGYDQNHYKIYWQTWTVDYAFIVSGTPITHNIVNLENVYFCGGMVYDGSSDPYWYMIPFSSGSDDTTTIKISTSEITCLNFSNWQTNLNGFLTLGYSANH